MNAWLPKAKALWLLGIALALAGALPVLYLVGLLAWQSSALLHSGAWIALPASLAFADHALLAEAKAAPVLAYLPELPQAWLSTLEAWPRLHKALLWGLSSVHIGALIALPGLPVIRMGVLVAASQRDSLKVAQLREADRLRRVPYYRNDERKEPFIGPGTGAEQAEGGPNANPPRERRRAAAAG